MNNVDINQFEFEEISKKDTLLSIIESLLFVSGEPLGVKDIAKILECSIEDTEMVLEELKLSYEDSARGIKLITINGMYQLVTKPQNSDFIQKLLKKNTRQSLSQASLESLAIIAYKQPITRIDIDEIRGVKSDSAIQKLVEKNLVKEVGRLDVIGRPIQYGTTDEFLRQFGLQDLKELPSLDLFADNIENEEETHYDES
ncbi:segregation and condensation protein B [Clostridium polyendosporum]|uniref:Segregation and condensation protein B n=1 Tax=Clostridium polyendosporum TaxID=69208 RepID=A0A919S2A9_9CLOT|nr:SMC-Scp complex subunit ScpB [Clostridium polyendosporum]GIM30549.1 segregation and condensation protein B [Clostridium polyendosporum]